MRAGKDERGGSGDPYQADPYGRGCGKAGAYRQVFKCGFQPYQRASYRDEYSGAAKPPVR